MCGIVEIYCSRCGWYVVYLMKLVKDGDKHRSDQVVLFTFKLLLPNT